MGIWTKQEHKWGWSKFSRGPPPLRLYILLYIRIPSVISPCCECKKIKVTNFRWSMINYKPFPNNPLRQFFGYHRLFLTLCMQILRKLRGYVPDWHLMVASLFSKKCNFWKSQNLKQSVRVNLPTISFGNISEETYWHFEFCFANKEYSPKENYLCGHKSNHLFDILLPKELIITLATLAWVPFSKDNFSYTKCS